MASRIITRPDFDGIVCAVLLKDALGQHVPVLWAQPNQIQTGEVRTRKEDIVANLPIRGDCALWFDHHVSNAIESPRNGLFRIAPSAAGLVFEYFQTEIDQRFEELVRQADKIDDAQLNLDEILHPERYAYILVSMTMSADSEPDPPYWNHLVEQLRRHAIKEVLENPRVKTRCSQVIVENRAYRIHLINHTRKADGVSLTDFRGLNPVPNGNRFLVYSLFPDTYVNVKLYHEKEKTVLKIGHSIINRNCHVNVGRLLATYGGGGHRGAGACRLEHTDTEGVLAQVLDILKQNTPDP